MPRHDESFVGIKKSTLWVISENRSDYGTDLSVVIFCLQDAQISFMANVLITFRRFQKAKSPTDQQIVSTLAKRIESVDWAILARCPLL